MANYADPWQAITDLVPNIRSRLPVRALFFFGTPHNGLEGAAALKTLVKGHPTETLVSELTRGSPTLTGLTSCFIPVAKDLVIHTYYQSRPTDTVAQVKENFPSRIEYQLRQKQVLIVFTLEL
jgi:hypothetical protein